MTSSYVESLLEGVALDTALHDVALEAQHAVTGVDAAGAVVEREPDSRVLASSNALAAEVDGVQYRAGQGPCLHAFRTNRVVLLDLGDHDGRWPAFQAAALAAGAQTVLSVPLRLDDLAIGSLNLYSRSRDAFSTKVVRAAELYARPAALHLSWCGVAVHAVETVEVAILELQDRALVERAVGVLMAVHQDPSVERARLRLEQVAVGLGLDLPLAAAQVVAAPPGRAG
jgi:transcriptional regulator with GAF, ATPase, and Fis domain